MLRNQERTTITNPNTWVAITIPVGAKDFRLSMESGSATFRVSIDNTINATTAGMPIAITGVYSHEGTNTAELTIYVSASITTVAILQYN
jgi:hypothetical protein